MARTVTVAHASWGHGAKLNPWARSRAPLNLLHCIQLLCHETLVIIDRKHTPIGDVKHAITIALYVAAQRAGRIVRVRMGGC